jgi:hypothetical protein
MVKEKNNGYIPKTKAHPYSYNAFNPDAFY